MDMVDKAVIFAATAHSVNGQKRKYTGEPYIVHPIEVMKNVMSVPHTPEMLAAALLHDVLEDTPTKVGTLRKLFNKGVVDLVLEVTDVSKPSDGNRAVRKALDRDHLAKASAQGQTIKLADLLNNTSSILQHDQEFAKVYLKEKQALLEVLTKGDPSLHKQCTAVVNLSVRYFNTEKTNETTA